jgi:hypothetical protein
MDFATNQKNYFDVAVDEQDTFVAAEPEVKYQEPDEDLRRAISGDELKKRMRVAIHHFFSSK